MPSVHHEALVALLRAHPRLLTHLVGLPEHGWELASTDLGAVLPVERRADVLLRNPAAGRAAIVEVARKPEPDRHVVWAGYQVAAVQQTGFPVDLFVIATHRRVASWAKRPLFLGGGSVFQAVVLGPDAFAIHDEPEDPHLAVLTALIHAQARDAERAARAAIRTLAEVDTSAAREYLTSILACVAPRVRATLEAMMLGLNLPEPEIFRILEAREREAAKAEGRQEGRQEGREAGREEGERHALLSMLRLRFGDLPAWAHQRAQALAGDSLRALLPRVLHAETLERVFEP